MLASPVDYTIRKKSTEEKHTMGGLSREQFQAGAHPMCLARCPASCSSCTTCCSFHQPTPGALHPRPPP